MPLTKTGWRAETQAPRPATARRSRSHGSSEVLVVRQIEPLRDARAYETAKRLLDLLTAGVLLVMLLPLFVLVAVVIKLESPGPVFFRQVRCGRHCRRFVVLKFRSMRSGASPESHRRYIGELARSSDACARGLKKLTDDPRVTRVGALLRKTSIDELPQLLNVLVGQMSIVGPRPAIDYELEHYAPEHWVRFDVKPGLTGLWQVSGRNRLGFREMLRLDCEYARSRSLRQDIAILLRTPLAILRSPGA